ncbi:hypothetical protein FOL47_009420 [Perkinsus chesapeaki]|uniref:Isopenicillin N synthase-like Fe(2+) 2OG dioxygenase domain-containing protein n=1 Tax=Perkinsus chesapeaki TaxID=330153 RepID=A0A7J6L8G3_PERCH|nr:hypothetical protein FOL47_009420 [Perkinsus chesapeaki]
MYISLTGVFTLSDLPNQLAKAYDTLAIELPKCGSDGIDGRTEELGDGTLRTTYAQKSMKATPHFLQRICDSSVIESVNYIRTQLEGIGNEVAKTIDKVITFNTPTTTIIDYDGMDVNSVVDIIKAGYDNHLDHIHVYTKTDNNINDNKVDWKDDNSVEGIHYNTTLTLHIDQGVFLLLILPPGDSNFYYEDGITNEQVPLNIPSLDHNYDGLRVVVLMGNTLKSFIGTTPSIRPLPHAVHMDISSTTPTRLVFGRMFLLPPSFKSPIPSLNSITFQQWTQAAMIPNNDDTDEIAFSKRRLGKQQQQQ